MQYKNFLRLSFIKQKWFRRVIRGAIGIFAFYLLILTSLSIYISSSRERLLTFLNAQIKQTILGEFKINKADITVWQTFPKLGLTLDNVIVSDSLYYSPFLKADEIVVKAGILI